ALLDLRPLVIGDIAPAEFLAAQRGATGAFCDRYLFRPATREIGRHPVDGHLVPRLTGTRTRNLGLVISGGEGRAIADLHSFEVRREETCGVVAGPAGGRGTGCLPILCTGKTASICATEQA